MKKISQREARRLQKEVERFKADASHRQNSWIKDYPGGVQIDSLVLPDLSIAKLRTARKLGHIVVITLPYNENTAYFYATKG